MSLASTQRILLVEDEPGLREVLTLALEGAGFRCEAVSGIEEGQRALREASFDGVLSDLKLKDGSGIELLTWMKEQGLETPVVIMTAFVIDRDVLTVIGVMPSDFRLVGELQPGRESAFDQTVQVFVPASPANRPGNRGVTGNWRGIVVVGRLKDSVAFAEARTDVERIANRANLAGGGTGGAALFSLEPIRRAVAGDLSSRLTVLSLAVALLLIAACGNVANLLLEHLERRRGELALRAALGASAWQLARAVLAETALITAGGGSAGCFVAWGGVRLVQVYGGAALASLAAVRVNLTVLGFAAVLSALTAVPLGLVLTARLVRLGIGRSLHAHVAEPRLGGRVSLPGVLVVNQMVMAVTLVVVGALLARDLASLAHVELGFKPDRILTAEISLDRVRYSGHSIPFFSELLERLNAAPGVERAALANCAPGFEVMCGGMVQVEGGPALAVEDNTVSDDYFAVMSIPLLAGRTLSRDDSLGRRSISTVVNEAFAQAHWPSVRDAVGKRLQRPNTMGREPLMPYEVVGVVGNSREMGSTLMFKPRIYSSYRQVFWLPRSTTVLAKARGEAGTLAGTLAAEVSRLDPDQPLSKALSLERIVSARYARQRLMLVMMVSFAVLTLLLAAVGIHGVIAYAVTLRRREIGVRLAFGATGSSVVRLFVLRAMRLVVVGLVIGLPVAIGLRWIAVVEWVGSAESDWLTCVAGVAVVALTGALAALVPAWRAARLDAMDVLRCD